MDSEIRAGKRVHLELRRDTFVVYTADQRIDFQYGEVDELVEHLMYVISSDEYRIAETLPPVRGGEILGDARPLRPASGRRLYPLCHSCKKKITNPRVSDLSMRRTGRYTCIDCMEAEAR